MQGRGSAFGDGIYQKLANKKAQIALRCDENWFGFGVIG